MNMKIVVISSIFYSSLCAMQQGSQVYAANAGSTVSTSANMFLEYYSKQGSDVWASVYYHENGNLSKRDISYDDLQRAVVIFFGDWCPHCHKFLTEFSKHITKLSKHGIKVILLHVPTVERLKNWQEPTVQEYNDVITKLSNSGIKPSSNVNVVLLGDRNVLTKAGVSGLPVFLAVKNSKEYFRGVGDNGVSKLKLGDKNVWKQFLEIFGDNKQKADKKVEKVQYNTDINVKKKALKPKMKSKATQKTKKGYSRPDRINARVATEMLNNMPWKFDLNSIK